MLVAQRHDSGLDDSRDILGLIGLRLFRGWCGLGGYGDGTDLRPCLAVVGAAIDPYCPRGVAFDGCAAYDCAVRQDEWLVLDGAKKACGKMLGQRPRASFVVADKTRARPGAGVRAEFVVQPEFAVSGVEEDWIPAGNVGLANEDIRGGPLIGCAARSPYGGVGSALGGSSKPSGKEISVPQFNDGGCVCRSEGG